MGDALSVPFIVSWRKLMLVTFGTQNVQSKIEKEKFKNCLGNIFLVLVLSVSSILQ